jgi:hypothetical protein
MGETSSYLRKNSLKGRARYSDDYALRNIERLHLRKMAVYHEYVQPDGLSRDAFLDGHNYEYRTQKRLAPHVPPIFPAKQISDSPCR